MKNLKINNELVEKLLYIGAGIVVGSIFNWCVMGNQDAQTEMDSNEVVESLDDSTLCEERKGEVLLEPIGLDWEPYVMPVKELEKNMSQKAKEDSQMLEIDPVYEEIIKYVDRVTSHDVESFKNEILHFYGIDSNLETFRFDPNNEEVMDQKIKEYARNMNSEENMTYWTHYQVKVSEEDYVVKKFMEDYQASYLNATEEELQEKKLEYQEKASAMYYAKMNLKYLSADSLRLLNSKYHFLEGQSLEEIKSFVEEAPIDYTKTPLIKELVARNEDYLAHSLLDSNEKYLDLIGFEESEQEKNAKIADEVIRGVYGNGEVRQRNLVTLGYDYDKVQEIVNQKMWGQWKETDIERITLESDPLSRMPILPTNGEDLCQRAILELVVQKQLLEDAVNYGFNPQFKGPYSYDPQMMLIKTVIHRQFYEIGVMLWEKDNVVDCNEVQREVLEEVYGESSDYSIDGLFEKISQVQEKGEVKIKTY